MVSNVRIFTALTFAQRPYLTICTDFHQNVFRNMKLVTVTEPIFANTAFDRQLFIQNSHTDSHWNTTDSSAANNRSPKNGRTDLVPHTRRGVLFIA